MNDATHKEETLQEIGQSAFECIDDMVKALECDYDRLEELKFQYEELREQYREVRPHSLIDDSDMSWLLASEEREELEELEAAAGECADVDDADQRIQDDPLSVQVRSGWRTPGEDLNDSAEEYEILLSTGGPATRIIGELDQYGRPHTARLEAQDWWQPWTEYTEAYEDVLLTYANQFYFGE